MSSIAALGTLARICRHVFDKSLSEQSRQVDQPDLLVTLARRHRVQALCWHGLGTERATLPERFADALREDSRAIAEQGLRTAAASRELVARFRDARVPLLFLKGQAVGRLAYGDPLLKMSADIDILVRPADIEFAASLLGELGYRPEVPRDPAAIVEWHRFSKESVWLRTGSPPVELHSRVTDNPRLLPGLTAASPHQQVEIGHGISLPTFSRDELLAYLAVHGASSAWFRLKWLCDFAALLCDSGEEETERTYRKSVELGAGRAPGLALLLSHRLFDTALGANLQAELKGDTALQLLEKIALGQLCSVREPTERPLGTVGIHLSQLLLGNPRFAVSEGTRQVREIVGRR